MEEFKTCLDSGEMTAKVTAQLSAGSTAGVTGTPGTFVIVDGKAVDFIGGALPFESVKTTIDKYL
jgi:protein-disulfide isomerase